MDRIWKINLKLLLFDNNHYNYNYIFLIKLSLGLGLGMELGCGCRSVGVGFFAGVGVGFFLGLGDNSIKKIIILVLITSLSECKFTFQIQSASGCISANSALAMTKHAGACGLQFLAVNSTILQNFQPFRLTRSCGESTHSQRWNLVGCSFF